MPLNDRPRDDMSALLRATAPRPDPTGPDCLDEETIAAVVDGALDPVTREAATRHVASCARCRAAVAGVTRLMADAVVAAESAAVERRTLKLRWQVPLGLAAAAVLVLLLVIPGRTDRTSETERREPALTTTVAPVPHSPSGVVGDVTALRWSSVPHADRYRVRLFSQVGTVVWETETADTVAPLPDSVFVAAEIPYFWKVEARTGWDRWVASELVEFRVERPAR